MTDQIQIKRRMSGAPGAPAALKSGEMAHNEVDNILYIGVGDDLSGNATSIVALAGEGHFLTIAAAASLGGGDMLAASYDTNADGKVNAADVADTANAVAWTNVTGKPSEFPPSAHDASLIATGTFDPARLPAFGQAPIVSSGALGDLTPAQQADVAEGSSVVTSDGSHFKYTGSGNVTSQSSYVLMADVTPDWSQISNKPATFPPSTHTHTPQDIFGLGSMATQAASAVDVTGGTIDGVVLTNSVLDGGTF